MYILEFYIGNFSLSNFSLHNTVPYIYMNRTTKSVVVREGWNEWVVMSDCVNFCRRLESTSSSSLLATLQTEGGPKQSQETIYIINSNLQIVGHCDNATRHKYTLQVESANLKCNCTCHRPKSAAIVRKNVFHYLILQNDTIRHLVNLCWVSHSASLGKH
jgi:hypothetical protein